jgi:DNA invertase Pin-like site-specific DNA recombinase
MSMTGRILPLCPQAQGVERTGTNPAPWGVYKTTSLRPLLEFIDGEPSGPLPGVRLARKISVMAPNKRRVALYARVSTLDQSPESQIKALREFAARRDFEVVGEYVDTVTGNMEKRRERPDRAAAYLRLMADAKARKFECLVVWKFDRFARSLPALIDALQTFSAWNIDFISATQDVDTTTPMGRLFFHIVGAFAEFERELIVERVNAGLANARAKGIKLGRRTLPNEPEVVERYKNGETIQKIAKATQRSRAGVRLVLIRHGAYDPLRDDPAGRTKVKAGGRPRRNR